MHQNYDSICCFRSNNKCQTRRVCWEITTECNLKCPFCHRNQEAIASYDINRINDTIELLKNKNIKNIIISGGEPLLYPKIFELLDILDKNGFELDLCTNGTLIYDDTLINLKKYLTEISISIDGYDCTRHDNMRGVTGSFEKTVLGIKQLNLNGFNVHTTTVIDSEFSGNIYEMVKFLDSLGVKSISLLGLIPLGKGKNELLSDRTQNILRQEISRARKDFNININTKQLLVKESICVCGAGNIVWGLGPDGLNLVNCLLTRNRHGFDLRKTGEGLCPGSKFLSQKKENKNA